MCGTIQSYSAGHLIPIIMELKTVKILSLLGQLTAADTFTIHLSKICMQY
jgi:hypothetical protein